MKHEATHSILALLAALGLLAGCPSSNDDDSAANDDDSAANDDDSVSDDDDSVGDDDDSVGDDDDSSSTGDDDDSVGDDDDSAPAPDTGTFFIDGYTTSDISNVNAADGVVLLRATFGPGSYYDLTVSWPPGDLATGDCSSEGLQVAATWGGGGTSVSGAQAPEDCVVSSASWAADRLMLDVSGNLWDSAAGPRGFSIELDVAVP